MSKNKLYILEKIWHFEPNMKFTDNAIYEVLIRPCNVSYRTYCRFVLNLPVRCKCIIHEGCVLSFFPNDNVKSYVDPNFKTLDEFMIYADLKCFTPLIENHLVIDERHQSYYAKTIDLKNNKVIYDKEKDVLMKLNEHYK